MGRLDQRPGRLAGPLPARHRVGEGRLPLPPAPALLLAGGAAATAALILWAGYPASMVGVNGAPHLEPQPAHPGRRDLRHRPGRPRAAAAGPAGPLDAPPGRVGGRRDGQPVRHDLVPLAPDGPALGHRGRARPSGGSRACIRRRRAPGGSRSGWPGSPPSRSRSAACGWCFTGSNGRRAPLSPAQRPHHVRLELLANGRRRPRRLLTPRPSLDSTPAVVPQENSLFSRTIR